MNNRLVLALLVSAVAVSVLIGYAVRSTSKKVVTVEELIAGPSRGNVRLGARVVGDIRHSESPARVDFAVREPGPGGDDKPRVMVTYFGVMPPSLKEDRDVILEGDYEHSGAGGQFVAKHLLTQCPSKYEPPKPKVQGST